MTFPLDPAAPVPPDGENPIRDMNPYRYEGANLMSRAAWDSGYSAGFAAGRAAASPDPPTDERRPWPIAPDTVMPPRRQPVRWGSRADDPPTEIHDDPGKTKAYLAGLAAGRTEAAAASPDERLREADVIEAVAWSLFPDHPRPMSEAGLDCARRAIDTALFAAADREKPDDPKEKP